MIFSLLVACTLVCGLLVGLIPALIDSLKKSWQDRLNLSPAQSEWALRFFYLIWLPAMPFAGWMIEHWHSKEILFFSLTGMILAVAWLGMVRSFASLSLCVLLLGVAYSVATVTTIRLMTRVFFAEDAPLAAMNLGFIAVVVGAWLAPGLFRFAQGWWGYRQALLYISLSCIGPAALTALVERENFPRPALAPASWEEVVVHPHFALIAGILLLYFAMENCLEYWPDLYLKDLGYESRGAQASQLIFWLAFTAMRAASAAWFHEHPDHAFGLTLIFVIVSAMVMGNLVGGYEVGSGSIGFWLAGACYGPMLPCFLGLALLLFPNLSPIALGILLSLSGLDTLIVRPVMRAYATNRPARTVMRVPTMLAFLVAAPLLVLAFIRR